MSMKWEKDYYTNRYYRTLDCYEFSVDETHSVLILRRDKTYDSYVMEKSPGEPLGTPFLYMFGTEIGSMTFRDIVDTTIANAPNYYDLFEED